MENFQSHDPINGFIMYYSCDFPGCKKTRNKPRRNLLSMPSGWFGTFETDENGKKIEKHYCIKHYNELRRRKRNMENSIYLNSPDNKYRYALGTKGENTLYCFGINPSTATPEKYDPTIIRVSKTALKMGFDSFVMLNVYPLRATDPGDLPGVADTGRHLDNIKAIIDVIKDGSTIWAAWGDSIDLRSWLRIALDGIQRSIQEKKKNIKWVKMGDLTKKGNPRHPLYLKYQPFSEYIVKK